MKKNILFGKTKYEINASFSVFPSLSFGIAFLFLTEGNVQIMNLSSQMSCGYFPYFIGEDTVCTEIKSDVTNLNSWLQVEAGNRSRWTLTEQKSQMYTNTASNKEWGMLPFKHEILKCIPSNVIISWKKTKNGTMRFHDSLSIIFHVKFAQFPSKMVFIQLLALQIHLGSLWFKPPTKNKDSATGNFFHNSLTMRMSKAEGNPILSLTTTLALRG